MALTILTTEAIEEGSYFIDVAFYDEDGDGIFETREPVGVPDVNRLHWIELPEWVKNTQQN